jgi:ubiquinone biosynthesis protein
MGLQRTYKHFRRYRQIAEILLRQGFGYLIEQLGLRRFLPWSKRGLVHADPQPDPSSLAFRVRLVLESLGPTFVKFGQVLSTRPDLVSRQMIQELEKLQDNVEPVAFEEMERVLVQELGGPVLERFASFDTTPLASASLGQVHGAKLFDGSDVVVKVQRPGIEGVMRTDLEIMRGLAEIYQERFQPPGFSPVEIVDEFAVVLLDELDYTYEGTQMERMGRDVAQNPRVSIPKVYWELTTSRVLTMDRVYGTKIDRIDELKARGIDLKQTAENLIEVFFEQVFLHGFFHGDPHPGNLFVNDEGVLSLIDFGMMGYLDDDTLDSLVGIFFGVKENDPKKVVANFGKMGILPKGVDLAPLQRDVFLLVNRYYGVPLKELSVGDVFLRSLDLVKKHHLRVPADFSLLVKTVVTVEGLARQLDPDTNVLKILESMSKEMLRLRFDPIRLGKRSWERMISLTQAAPGIILSSEQLLEKLNKNDLGIHFYHEGLEGFIHRLDIISNRLTFGLIVSALIIGSSLVLLFDKGPRLLGYPILGLAGYLLAGFIGLWLLVSILRTGKL